MRPGGRNLYVPDLWFCETSGILSLKQAIKNPTRGSRVDYSTWGEAER